jgi:hypothetical protein
LAGLKKRVILRVAREIDWSARVGVNKVASTIFTILPLSNAALLASLLILESQ